MRDGACDRAIKHAAVLHIAFEQPDAHVACGMVSLNHCDLKKPRIVLAVNMALCVGFHVDNQMVIDQIPFMQANHTGLAALRNETKVFCRDGFNMNGILTHCCARRFGLRSEHYALLCHTHSAHPNSIDVKVRKVIENNQVCIAPRCDRTFFFESKVKRGVDCCHPNRFNRIHAAGD